MDSNKFNMIPSLVTSIFGLCSELDNIPTWNFFPAFNSLSILISLIIHTFSFKEDQFHKGLLYFNHIRCCWCCTLTKTMILGLNSHIPIFLCHLLLPNLMEWPEIFPYELFCCWLYCLSLINTHTYTYNSLWTQETCSS